jgi:hypothetical protein
MTTKTNVSRNVGAAALVCGLMLVAVAIGGGVAVVSYLETGLLASMPMPPAIGQIGAMAVPAQLPLVGGATISGLLSDGINTLGLPLVALAGVAGLALSGVGMALQRRPATVQ